MLYIKHISSVIPQRTFELNDTNSIVLSKNNQLQAIEPSYVGIPNAMLRRMGKAVRISVGAALPILQQEHELNGIIIGTANGGMEDSIKFMNQIIQYLEDMLAPGNFVQSTPNGIAAQIGLIQKNKNYNITHVHRGLAFENAVLDAAMQLKTNPEATFLLGATDEISTYNYTIDLLAGWYKQETVSNIQLYDSASSGSIAGEGAVMMIVDADPNNALFELRGIQFWQSNDEEECKRRIENFLNPFLNTNEAPELMISGENGDNRFTKFYEISEKLLPSSCAVCRFKHLSGEYPTAVSQAFTLASHIFSTQEIPGTTLKKQRDFDKLNNILIYNTYHGQQHSLIFLSHT